LAFLFVPINSSILSQFTGVNLGQVSGLLNLFRQIGGSMGIALVATLMTSKGHQNYLDLSSNLSLLNPNTQSMFYQTMGGMKQKMSDAIGMATSADAALKSLYYRVQNQVFMMSFLQLVWLIMIIFAVAFIPLYRLKFKMKVKGPIDAH
jgi:DHA2 family multidrug resistance protein